MGKVLLAVVAMLFLGVFRLSSADLENVQIPFLSSASASGNAAYASAKLIGTPAAVTLPEADPSTWFSADSPPAAAAVAPWTDILTFVNAAGTPAGWAEACKKASAGAGSDRGTNPELGALACSDDHTVTELQQFARDLLAARGEVALWSLGVAGHDTGAAAARIAEVRHACENGLPSRMDAASAYGEACKSALAATSLPADAAALYTALGQAYSLVAADLATRDATIDPEPYTPPGAAAATPTPAS